MNNEIKLKHKEKQLEMMKDDINLFGGTLADYQKVRILQKEIQRLKHLIKCKHCGRSLSQHKYRNTREFYTKLTQTPRITHKK